MKKTTASFRLPMELKAKLKATAKRARIRSSEIVRYALETYLAEVERTGKVTSPEKSTDINK